MKKYILPFVLTALVILWAVNSYASEVEHFVDQKVLLKPANLSVL